MIFLPLALVTGAVIFFLAGFFTDTIPLLVVAMALAAVSGLSIFALRAMRAKAMEAAAAKSTAAGDGPPTVVSASPAATPAAMAPSPADLTLGQPAAALPMAPAIMEPLILPAGAPVPPGYVAYVPAAAMPAAVQATPPDEVFAPPATPSPALPRPAGRVPIAGYDGLRASDIIQRVRTNGLSRSDLRALRAYELGRASRKTVLAAIDRELARQR